MEIITVFTKAYFIFPVTLLLLGTYISIETFLGVWVFSLYDQRWESNQHHSQPEQTLDATLIGSHKLVRVLTKERSDKKEYLRAAGQPLDLT